MEEKQKMIYISGKIGEKVLSEATIFKFEHARLRLLMNDWVVIDPASPKYQKVAKMHVKIEEEKWKDLEYGYWDWYSWMLLWDMHQIALCDAIYMLKDWRQSPGATAEYNFAKACGKEIIFESKQQFPKYK